MTVIVIDRDRSDYVKSLFDGYVVAGNMSQNYLFSVTWQSKCCLDK